MHGVSIQYGYCVQFCPLIAEVHWCACACAEAVIEEPGYASIAERSAAAERAVEAAAAAAVVAEEGSLLPAVVADTVNAAAAAVAEVRWGLSCLQGRVTVHVQITSFVPGPGCEAAYCGTVIGLAAVDTATRPAPHMLQLAQDMHRPTVLAMLNMQCVYYMTRKLTDVLARCIACHAGLRAGLKCNGRGPGSRQHAQYGADPECCTGAPRASAGRHNRCLPGDRGCNTDL